MKTDIAGQDRALTDEELVNLARNGNTCAFGALSERYAVALKSRANRYSSVVGIDVEDFVQEGMLALFKAVKGFDASMGIQFRTYAAACVNNAMATAIKIHMKSLGGVSGIPIDDASEPELRSSARGKPRSIEDIFIEQENSAILVDQIQTLLSNFEQQVLKLYLRGNSYLEISCMLSTSTKAVDNALQRVRRKLRPEL